jgi:hypothetical protein
MLKKIISSLSGVLMLVSASLHAAPITFDLMYGNGTAEANGTITFDDTILSNSASNLANVSPNALGT